MYAELCLVVAHDLAAVHTGGAVKHLVCEHEVAAVHQAPARCEQHPGFQAFTQQRFVGAPPQPHQDIVHLGGGLGQVHVLPDAQFHHVTAPIMPPCAYA